MPTNFYSMHTFCSWITTKPLVHPWERWTGHFSALKISVAFKIIFLHVGMAVRGKWEWSHLQSSHLSLCPVSIITGLLQTWRTVACPAAIPRVALCQFSLSYNTQSNSTSLTLSLFYRLPPDITFSKGLQLQESLPLQVHLWEKWVICPLPQATPAVLYEVIPSHLCLYGLSSVLPHTEGYGDKGPSRCTFPSSSSRLHLDAVITQSLAALMQFILHRWMALPWVGNVKSMLAEASPTVA